MLAALLVPGFGRRRDSEADTKLFNQASQVVLVRHAITTPGVGDPPAFRLDDCATQRNLTDEGRGDARRLGEAFRARGIPVARVLSSPWCRCLETGRLAFGAAEPWWPRANLVGRPANRGDPLRAPDRRQSGPGHPWLDHRGADRHQPGAGRDGRADAPGRGSLHRGRPFPRCVMRSGRSSAMVPQLSGLHPLLGGSP